MEHIYRQGGIFKRYERLDGEYTLESIPYAVAGLKHARVCRPDSFRLPVGLSRKHMGLSDSFGDVIMKLEPALFKCELDVTLLARPAQSRILLASDGLWACLPGSSIDQCNAILEQLESIPVFIDEQEFQPLGNDDHLKSMASWLCQRSAPCFVNPPRLDDVVCVIVDV